MSEATEAIRRLSDGVLTSIEIAALVGVAPRYVRRVQQNMDLPRLTMGSRPGDKNHQFVAGRRVTLQGYVQVSPPAGHSTAKPRPGRPSTWIFEHRLVAEQSLGRYLLPTERVDHIDGLTLHNSPDNLRLFQDNAQHLRETLTGKVPRWSDAGYENMKLRHRPGAVLELVDTHRQRTASGDVRLRQILLLALQLGTDSPFLLGTHHHTTKAGIDMSSRPTIERALADLCARWGWAPPP